MPHPLEEALWSELVQTVAAARRDRAVRVIRWHWGLGERADWYAAPLHLRMAIDDNLAQEIEELARVVLARGEAHEFRRLVDEARRADAGGEGWMRDHVL